MSKDRIHGMKLAHHEYFRQFNDIVEKGFSINDKIEGYRTCQSIPCSDDDSLPRIFRKKIGQEPEIPKYSDEELDEMDDFTKYSKSRKVRCPLILLLNQRSKVHSMRMPEFVRRRGKEEKP